MFKVVMRIPNFVAGRTFVYMYYVNVCICSSSTCSFSWFQITRRKELLMSFTENLDKRFLDHIMKKNLDKRVLGHLTNLNSSPRVIAHEVSNVHYQALPSVAKLHVTCGIN